MDFFSILTLLGGLALFLYGMQVMGDGLAKVSGGKLEKILENLTSSKLKAVLLGLAVTAVIQSSSATTVMVVGFVNSGIMKLTQAVGIIMGANIGTCVTALLSAIGANKNAKRAAMIHLYFNMLGTVIFLGVFYLLNSVLHFSFMDSMATPAAIAITHSIFNVTATLIWLPFSNVLVKLACLTIRDSAEDVEAAKEDQEFMILESRFLEKPAFAVEQGRTAARRMAEDSGKSLKTAFALLHQYDEEGAKKIDKLEGKVDRYEDELGTYLVQLNNKDLSENDSHSVSIMLHCIGDFERISDHAVNIKESAEELHEKNLSFSPVAKAELRVVTAAVNDIVETAFRVFDAQDTTKAMEIEALEELIDELTKEMKRRHINRLRSGECTIEMGFILSDLITSMERIADHCSNIGVCVTQVRENLYDTHSHLNALKNEDSDDFEKCLEKVRQEYLLP